MNLARKFSYTKDLEKQADSLLEELRKIAQELFDEQRKLASEQALRLTAEAVRDDRLRELGDVRLENKELRKQNAELIDRVAIKLQMVPPTEPLKSEPLTPQETAARSEKVDSIRRTGPVAKSRQEAEAAYFAEQARIEELRRKDANTPTVSELNAAMLEM